MTTLYVESSALARILIEGDDELGERLESAEARVTSALTLLETARSISRARRDGRLTAPDARAAERRLAVFERSADILDLTADVLRHARDTYPIEPVRTLDAIHLASVVLLDQDLSEDLVVVSTDERVRQNAAALGFTVVP
jgi:uncharacterized protein